MKFRFAVETDLESIVNIYNQAVGAGNATADLEEWFMESRQDWFHTHDEDAYPLYAIDVNNEVIGWGSLSPYRQGRGGLRATAEISFYIDYRHHCRGYGQKLITHIMTDCPRVGIKHLFALLLEINTASMALLEKCGFARWGLMPDVVDMHGITCGHLIYGRKVGY